MKILPFHDSLNAIRKQLTEMNHRLGTSSTDKRADTFNKKEFLNSIILESLNESEREKEQILNSLMEEICYMDLNYNIIWMNDAALNSISSSTSMDEIIGQPCYEVWHGRSKPCRNCPVSTTIKTGWPWKEEISHPDGTTKLVSSQPVIDDNGVLTGIIEVELDITMRKEVELALEKSQQRARALLDVIPDLLFVFNSAGNFIDYHPGADFDLITNTENPEGKHLTEIMPENLAAEIIKNSGDLFESGATRIFEFEDSSGKNNFYYSCRLIKTGANENVCIIRDISTQKSREKEIFHKSFHDSLTGLYNRAYFEEELNRIEHSRQSLPVSILVIDVNGLKFTNDAFGHDFGDKLLRKVAGILSANCRASDVIARTGGDEFAIILPASPIKKALKLSERIIAACDNSDYSDIFARPSVSVGCAEKTDNSLSLQDIIKIADEQMYKMKLTNRTRHLNILMNDILDTMKDRIYDSENHIENCIKLSEHFAKKLHISTDSLEQIRKLALLHDIGNIRLSESLLSKPGPLTAEEESEIRQHPIIGYRIAKTIPAYASVADLILYHQEHWDGKGYPSGLTGKEIPPVCRLFSIINSYDTLIRGSKLKQPMTAADALLEIIRGSGKQFDPELVDSFVGLIRDDL